jgi:uncharacterized protein (TIGR03435 family)
MNNRVRVRLRSAKRAALAVAGTAVLGMPFVLGVMNSAAIQAQSSVPQPGRAAKPRFEVASVKPCLDTARFVRGEGGGAGSPVRLVLNCLTVESLIQNAYLMYRDGHFNPGAFFLVPITGGPTWVATDRYTIDAKVENPASQEMMKGPMLQALLEDRFQLKIHREAREIPVYELQVAPGGAKLQATKETSCVPLDPSLPPAPPTPGQRPACGVLMPDPNGGMVAYGQKIPALCMRFSGILGQPILDKTGMAGAFDIHLALSPADLVPHRPGLEAPTDTTVGEPVPDPVRAFQRAVRKLGLQLVSARGPGETLIIDHLEKPSAN